MDEYINITDDNQLPRILVLNSCQLVQTTDTR